jgi:hypothetical protein
MMLLHWFPPFVREYNNFMRKNKFIRIWYCSPTGHFDEQYHRPTLPNYLRLFQYLNLDWYYRFCLISSICQRINVSSNNVLTLLKKKYLLRLLHININLGRRIGIVYTVGQTKFHKGVNTWNWVKSKQWTPEKWLNTEWISPLYGLK